MNIAAALVVKEIMERDPPAGLPERNAPVERAIYVQANNRIFGVVFRFLVLIGSGTGAVLLVRWFWWRVNAWTEIVAMLVGLALAIFASMQPWSWGARLAFTTFGTMAVWLPVTLLTRPEQNEVLDAFYARIRPGGWWRPVRQRTGLTPLDNLARDGGRWLLWVVVVLGSMLGIGWVLLL